MPTENQPSPRRGGCKFSLTDRQLSGLLWQILVVVAVVAVIAWLWSNTVHNLSVRRIATGFAFLGREAGMPIADTWLPYSPKDTYLRAFIVGLTNTLRVAVIGIVLATVLGTLVGIARLSANWLLSRLAAVYVEALRDIPLLLQLLFWYVLMQGLPRGAPGLETGRWCLSLQPRPDTAVDSAGEREVLGAAARGDRPWRGLVHPQAAGRAADDRRQATAELALYDRAGAGAAGAAVADAAGAPWSIELPELRGFNFVGGLTLAPEYFALLIALVTYTSAFIAEIVRSGIQAVPRGQWDAAKALGLRRSFVLQQIVLPQALRVIIPPMTSQYLNLTKNSSLAVAVGYQDIVSIANTTLNQTGQAIEAIALIMMVFLTISLGISFFMNWYNARIALVER